MPSIPRSKVSTLRGTAVISIAIAVLVAMALSTHAIAQGPASEVNNTGSSNYRIGPGDVLKVQIVKQEMLSQDGVRVANDGSIRLPMIDGPIPAQCLTEAELSSSISERYKKYILNPQVYVSVREFNAYPVAVVGAVNAPGRFQLQRPVRLLEILAYVNGPSPTAGKEIQILRTGIQRGCDGQQNIAAASDDQQEVLTYSLADVLKGNEQSNPYLKAGDVVRITEADLRQAFVIGSVRAAATINLKEPVTLSRAIAMAGGPAPGARTDKIKLLRQGADGAKSELVVSLKNLNNGSQDDINLQANDIVDVPGPSGTRKLLQDIYRTTLPVLTRGIPVVIP